jgi:replicative DNA helicase
MIDHEAECRVLSSMLHSETACITALDNLTDDAFSNPLNRQVFLLILSLYTKGTRPTYVELVKEGSTLGLIQGIKDMEKIEQISEHYIDDENINYWIQKVRQASKARKAHEILKKYTQIMNDGKFEVDQFISQASGDLFSLAIDSEEERIDNPEELAELGINLVLERVEKYRQMQDATKMFGDIPLEGLPTGIKALDNNTLGMKPGDLIILGAQTGHGKTAFALNVAKASSVDTYNSILYINTEMSKKQIAYRWGTMLSGMELHRIRAGNLTNEEKDMVVKSYQRLQTSGFYPIHIPNLTPEKLEILTRKAKLQKNIKLLILDYVGRMEKIQPDMQEWQVLEQIIKSVKLLAQNLEIACLVLVQLNADGTLQGAKRMENECDLMLKLLPVDEEGRERLEQRMKRRYEDFNYRLFIQKARDTESGISIPLVFDKGKQLIREAIPEGR